MKATYLSLKVNKHPGSWCNLMSNGQNVELNSNTWHKKNVASLGFEQILDPFTSAMVAARVPGAGTTWGCNIGTNRWFMMVRLSRKPEALVKHITWRGLGMFCQNGNVEVPKGQDAISLTNPRWIFKSCRVRRNPAGDSAGPATAAVSPHRASHVTWHNVWRKQHAGLRHGTMRNWRWCYHCSQLSWWAFV